MTVLGVESSCDETSLSVVEDGRTVKALVIASQTETHARYHGVVPEIASRAHVEQIVPVADEVLARAGLPLTAIDTIAVSTKPGLSGSLAVGLSFAKGVAVALGKPLVAVDHILAHAWAVQLVEPVDYPYLVLLVSGGHSLLGVCRAPTELDVLGATIDDACGEAFDKVGAYLGCGYPGGPAIERLAATGDATTYAFPKPTLKGNSGRLDFSYSGLKTAVVHQRERFYRHGDPQSKENVAAAFQRTAIDQLIDRLSRAIDREKVNAITMGGGVAANDHLRTRLTELADERGVHAVVPPPQFCVDNGAMVAGLGWAIYQSVGESDLAVGVNARVHAFRGRSENHRRGS